MPGRPLTRASQQIIASLTTTTEWWEGALDKIACGDSPKAIADEYSILFGVFMRWVDADEQRRREYDAALRIATEGHAHDCIAIADEQKEAVGPGGKVYDPDVARDKLRIETRLKLAGKWDRPRYGETVKYEHSGAVVAIDAGLVGIASQLLAARVRAPIDVTPSQTESTRAIDVSREPDGSPSQSASVFAVESPHPIDSFAAPHESGALPPPPARGTPQARAANLDERRL